VRVWIGRGIECPLLLDRALMRKWTSWGWRYRCWGNVVEGYLTVEDRLVRACGCLEERFSAFVCARGGDVCSKVDCLASENNFWECEAEMTPMASWTS
jgi:hypothetical protein